MKLREINQPTLPGMPVTIPSTPPKVLIPLNKPKEIWDAEETAANEYNQGGLLGLVTHMEKVFKTKKEEIYNELLPDIEAASSELEAVEEFIDIMYRIPLNAEAGGGGGGGAGGGGGGAGGGGTGAGAGAGAGASSGSAGGSTSSSGDSGSAGSGDTGSADSTPSDAPSMDAPVSRGYAFLGSMVPGKKKKKKKKKSKGFDFGKGVY